MDTAPSTPDDPLEVVSWTDLRALPAALDELLAQSATILDHARTHVCRTEPFEPSPVCVLRPLVPVLDRVGEAFEGLAHALADELGAVRADVEAALGGLAAADTDALGALVALEVLVAPTPWDEVA